MQVITAGLRHSIRIGLLIILSFLSFPFLGRTQQTPKLKPGEKLDLVVQSHLLQRSDARIPVIIQSADEDTAAADRLVGVVWSAGGIPSRSFKHIPAVTAVVAGPALDRLANDWRISRISVDHAVYGDLHTTGEAIGADQIWAGGGPTALPGGGL